MTAVLLAPPAYGSPEWVAWRRGGLGASDLPTVVGIDPWRGEYELAAIKRGTAPEDEETPRMRWGHVVEPMALAWYQEASGLEVIAGETWQDPRWPHLWATLDGRIPDRRIGLEVKWSARWDGLPRRVEVQALAQMGIAGLDAVDILPVTPDWPPTPVRVERDEDAIADLLELGEGWYRRYVLGDEWPPLDESRAARRALAGLRGEEERTADETQRTALAQLRQVRDAIKRLEATDRGLVRDLKASMAGAGVLVADGLGKATWSIVKGRRAVAWQSVAEGLRSRCTDEEWESVVSLATTVGEPGDRFAVTFEEE